MSHRNVSFSAKLIKVGTEIRSFQDKRAFSSRQTPFCHILGATIKNALNRMLIEFIKLGLFVERSSTKERTINPTHTPKTELKISTACMQSTFLIIFFIQYCSYNIFHTIFFIQFFSYNFFIQFFHRIYFIQYFSYNIFIQYFVIQFFHQRFTYLQFYNCIILQFSSFAQQSPALVK
jgi:hypothetical protein